MRLGISHAIPEKVFPSSDTRSYALISLVDFEVVL